MGLRPNVSKEKGFWCLGFKGRVRRLNSIGCSCLRKGRRRRLKRRKGEAVWGC